MLMQVPMWKPPARRAYAPKPLDPGQRIEWMQETRGYWTEPPSPVNIYGQRERGEWIPAVETKRAGVIWSPGPFPRSLWVQPDDAPAYPVLVMLPAPKAAQRGEGPAQTRGAAWARDAVRRAESVRAHGSVYAVLESEHRAYRYGSVPLRRSSWHADPCCPLAAGKEREPADRYGKYDVRRVLRIMLGQEQDGCSPSELCQHCIWLSVSEPAAANPAA